MRQLILSFVQQNINVTATMEHSAAIMQDAGKAIDGKGEGEQKKPIDSSSGNMGDSAQASNSRDEGRRTNNYDQRKRKANYHDSSMHHGSRGGRGGGRNDNKRHKKNDMGRGEYLCVYTSMHGIGFTN